SALQLAERSGCTCAGILLPMPPAFTRRAVQPRSRRSLALAFAAMLSVAAGCASVDPAIVDEPGTEFSLPVGKTAALNGSGTRITFRQVTTDSRCPVDVQCVWAVEAKIELIISLSGS